MNLGLKLRGIAGLSEQYRTPPFSPPPMDTGAVLRSMDNQQISAAPPVPAPTKGGFFKEGGLGRILAGTIGDTLLQQADMAPVYAPMMQQRQQSEAAEAQWQRQRMAKREDQQWEWQNKPQEQRAPSELERALQASGVAPGSPEWIKAMQQRTQSILNPDPPVTLTLPNGQLYVGPRSGLATAMGGAQGAAPAAPVGKLTPLSNGGPASAPGTFRP